MAPDPPHVDHRAVVWGALGPLMILGGAAVAIAAWQRVPSASVTDPHPSFWDSTSTAAPFIGGLVCLALGAYIILAAFFPPLWLPKTRRERSVGTTPESPSKNTEKG